METQFGYFLGQDSVSANAPRKQPEWNEEAEVVPQSRFGVDPEGDAGPGELGASSYFLRTGDRARPTPAPAPVRGQLAQRVSAPQHPVNGLLVELGLESGAGGGSGVAGADVAGKAEAKAGVGWRRRPWNQDRAVRTASVGRRPRRSI